MSETFKKGDRVIVTDLRIGTSHSGVYERNVEGDKVIVAYDSGIRVKVGRGFVRRAGS